MSKKTYLEFTVDGFGSTQVISELYSGFLGGKIRLTVIASRIWMKNDEVETKKTSKRKKMIWVEYNEVQPNHHARTQRKFNSIEKLKPIKLKYCRAGIHTEAKKNLLQCGWFASQLPVCRLRRLIMCVCVPMVEYCTWFGFLRPRRHIIHKWLVAWSSIGTTTTRQTEKQKKIPKKRSRELPRGWIGYIYSLIFACLAASHPDTGTIFLCFWLLHHDRLLAHSLAHIKKNNISHSARSFELYMKMNMISLNNCGWAREFCVLTRPILCVWFLCALFSGLKTVLGRYKFEMIFVT